MASFRISLQELEEVIENNRIFCKDGQVADYIPELANISGDKLGLTVHPIGGEAMTAGDCGQLFTLQSISKVFSLMIALEDFGERKVFEKVGMEPTGENYNSMLKLELIPGVPFNPMINAGAIAVSSMIKGEHSKQRADRVLHLVRKLTRDEGITYNEEVYESELASADRNRSLAYLLKDTGVLEGDLESHLETYIRHCSIEVTCSHIAAMASIMANDGIDPHTGDVWIPHRYVQIVKTFMTTCGMYNASGKFAIEVGLPAKSGVSGGIMSMIPGAAGIGTVGPALDSKGNSVGGWRILQELSEKYDLSIF